MIYPILLMTHEIYNGMVRCVESSVVDAELGATFRLIGVRGARSCITKAPFWLI